MYISGTWRTGPSEDEATYFLEEMLWWTETIDKKILKHLNLLQNARRAVSLTFNITVICNTWPARLYKNISETAICLLRKKGQIILCVIYCKSGYFGDVLIFAIFHESIKSQIYKLVKGFVCNIHIYTKNFHHEFIKSWNISRRRFSWNNGHANIKRFTVLLLYFTAHIIDRSCKYLNISSTRINNYK